MQVVSYRVRVAGIEFLNNRKHRPAEVRSCGGKHCPTGTASNSEPCPVARKKSVAKCKPGPATEVLSLKFAAKHAEVRTSDFFRISDFGFRI